MARLYAPGPWLFILSCAALSACPLSRLFESTGAPCRSEANCPTGQSCCAGKCSSACESGSAIVASITLSTDYVPGYEFDEVAVVLDGETRVVAANVTAVFFAAAPIGQFLEVVPDSPHVVVVSLRLAGVTVAERTAAFTASADILVPVVLSRDCAQVACDAPSQCLGGRCESAACFERDAAACLAPLCASDAQCPALVDCTTGVCTSGVCLQRRDDALCGPDERCLPGVGCMAREVECAEPADCEDNYLCTRESCERGRCSVTADSANCAGTLCAPGAFDADPVTGCTTQPFLLFACADGVQTIRLDWRCDGFANCADVSDELGCGYALFTCADGTRTIRADWRCDGFINCVDRSDEGGCGYETFACADGAHVTRLAWVCDGSTTCPDFSDEAGCGYALFTCASGLQAIRTEWVCDSFINCADQSDETACGYNVFVCADGLRVTRLEWRCDGSTTCPDRSDELGCGYELFVCADQAYAIRADWRCDGTTNCADASDEAGCP